MTGAEAEALAEEETIFGRLRRKATATAASEAEAELVVSQRFQRGRLPRLKQKSKVEYYFFNSSAKYCNDQESAESS